MAHPFPLGSVPLKISEGTGMEETLFLPGPGYSLNHKCTWVMFAANGLATLTTDLGGEEPLWDLHPQASFPAHLTSGPSIGRAGRATDGTTILGVKTLVPSANGKAGLVLGQKPPFSSLPGAQGTQGEGPECQHRPREAGAS